MAHKSCSSPVTNLWGLKSLTQTTEQNIVSTYKLTEAQNSCVQLWDAQIKSANCSVKISESNLNV